MSRGSFWITGERASTPSGGVLVGPMYVEWELPETTTPRTPIVLVHGGGGQGTDYLTTPDGRPGWAPMLVAAGHPVYVVDRPGHGRSPYDPQVLGAPTGTWGAEVLIGVFLGDPNLPLPPHTQWPGTLDGSDEVFEQFIATQGPLLADTATMHTLERDRLVALLDRIGPAIVVAHSAGGPGAFLAADSRPELVRAFVAVETLGPPFLGQPQTGMTLPWGLAAAPMRYEPPVADPSEFRLRIDETGPVPMALQEEPVRTLPGLAQVPIAIVTAQASPFRFFDGHLKAFLDQVGCTSEFVRLEDSGVNGNGHGMMVERNNADVLAVILDWLGARGLADGKRP